MLEQLFSVEWLRRKEHSFIIAFIYSLIGIISARLIFPENTGLMSIAFTSILLIPSLNILLKLEESIEIREKKLNLVMLFRDHKDIFKIYISMFLGIFFAYGLVTILFPEQMFEAQLATQGLSGMAFGGSYLTDIVANNILIFVVCLLLSLAYGSGSILFLTWNASVWGVVFAYMAKMSMGDPSGVVEIIPSMPHMVTEAAAYISAAISGGVVSKAALREKIFSKRFHHVLTDALIFLSLGFMLVLIAGVIEVRFGM